MNIRKLILPLLAGMMACALSLAGCTRPEPAEESVQLEIIDAEPEEETQEELPEDSTEENSTEEDLPAEEEVTIEVVEDVDQIDYDGVYTTKEDVGLYLYTYGELPSNFMTKKEARALGWQGGSLEDYAPGYCIGGDYFGNNEGILPDGSYHECDIDTLYSKKGRGAKRIVYSDDGRIYYTEDHYETFELLYGEE